MSSEYDYLVVGAGLFGSTFAQQAKEKGKRVLVIEKREHVGGNVYTEKIAGIHVHKYGAHIFHTNNKEVYAYLSRFASFNGFVNTPLARYRGKTYSLPFNMNTFREMWGVLMPQQAKEIINAQRNEITGAPANFEEQAICLVGREIYEKLIKGYSEKQWGRPCDQLPPDIIRRIPVRFTYDNRYYDDLYQGVPIGGYTKMIEKMLEGIELHLNEPYQKNRYAADKIIYTGPIDEYYDYCFGNLEYRKLRFEHLVLTGDFQGNAVVNYTDKEIPFTRITEHKWFDGGKDESGNVIRNTVISKEYSEEWKPGDIPYYPINDRRNNDLFKRYKTLAATDKNLIFGGRLGQYGYFNMDRVVADALALAKNEFQNKNTGKYL